MLHEIRDHKKCSQCIIFIIHCVHKAYCRPGFLISGSATDLQVFRQRSSEKSPIGTFLRTLGLRYSECLHVVQLVVEDLSDF